MYPADVAIDCIALFSRIVNSLTPICCKTLKNANARITDVMPTPSDQPVLAPM